MGKHVHAEAFCLMKYVSDDGTEEEVLWNSRDGVTPFVITLRSGMQATHRDWSGDVYAPDHQPKKGDRIFVNMTEKRAEILARHNMDQWEKDGTFAKWGAVPEFSDLVSSYYRPGAPDIEEV